MKTQIAALALLLATSAAHAADAIVYVAFVDDAFVTDARVDKDLKHLKDKNPQLIVHPVLIDIRSATADLDAARARLTRELTSLKLKPGQVRLLAINAPPKVFGFQPREVGDLGSVTALFEPLHGKLAEAGRVSLLGFRGLGVDTLLNTLGASEGSAFTMKSPPRAAHPLQPHWPALKRAYGYGSLLVGAAIGSIAVFNGEADSAVYFGVVTGLGTFVGLVTATAVAEQAWPWLLTVFGRANLGQVTKLQDGGVVQSKTVSALSRKRVFDCEHRFLH